MTPDVLIGNDVVDLVEPRTVGKAGDRRFVDRVLAAREREGLASAGDPDLELWSLWAAKEAAYKAVSKLRGEPPVFEHAAFVVSWSRTAPPAEMETEVRSGLVRWEDVHVFVSVMHRTGVLHALAHTHRASASDVVVEVGLERLDDADAPWAGGMEALLPRLTPREAEPVHSLRSAAVRVGARRALASLVGVAESRLEIVCRPGTLGRRPPLVLLDGEPAAADVSLSHDGAWIAWALWCPSGMGNATP